jgi:hypothetical protein
MNIEVTEEQFKTLEKMSENMGKQDHRCTRLPLFCVYQKEKRYSPINEGDHNEYIDEGHNVVANSDEELISLFNDRDVIIDEYGISEEIYDSATNLKNNVDVIANILELTSYAYHWVDVPVGGQVYFTEAGAQRHIDLNLYHYNKPFVYVDSAWRNPEMKTLLDVVNFIVNKKEAHR